MEVLFVTHKYPPVIGGMEKQSFELINGMKKLVNVHTIVYEGKGSRIKFFLSLNRRITSLCAENPGIKIIHYNDGLIAAFSLLFKQRRHIKQVVTLHGLDVVYPHSIYQQLILKKFNRFDLIIAVSRATANACVVRGIPAEKIVVINNGVDTQARPQAKRADTDLLLQEKYNIDSGARRLLVAIGRPVKRKGFSWFIKKVSPLLKDDFLLLLIGPVRNKKDRWLMDLLPAAIGKPIELLFGMPGDEQHIEELLQDPLIRNRVVRLGKLPYEDMNTLLSVADAFIMPNIEVSGDMEGFGLVCLEAAMFGTIVIAAASGGITDAIYPDQNGILVTPGDHTAWAKTINEYSTTQQLLKADIISFTKNHFSWEKMIKDYEAEFLKICAGNDKDF